MKAIIVFIYLLFVPNIVISQLPKDIVWQSCFGTAEQEIVEDLVETNDAYYILSETDIITGPDYNDKHDDILITKVNHLGQLIWQKNYGGSRTEVPASIIADSTGNIYFGCMSFSNDGDVQSGNMGGFDFWIVKIDTSGQIIWEQTFGGSRTDYGAYLLYLENGNILAYGATFSHDYDVNINYGFLDFWIWEITPDGEIVNSRVFGSTEPDNIFSLIQTSDGGFFTAARACANTGMVNAEPKGWCDMWLLKLDAELNIEWQKLLGGSGFDAGGRGVLELDDGGYIINGSTQSSDGDVHGFDFPDVPNQNDIWVVRIDSLGNILWDIALGGDYHENDSKIFQNQDGSFTVFGTTKSMNNGDVEGHHYSVYIPNYPNDDIWMVHLSADGELLDQRCFGNASGSSLRRGVIKKSDSHYLIAGTGVSRQADPYEPEYPEGEVWGGYTSTSYDVWFFEIKDCEQYPTEIPTQPIGVDTICTINTNQSIYTTTIAHPEYEQADWLLEPNTAGELINQQDTVLINWNPIFEGQISLSLRVVSDCDSSQYSEIKHTQVYNCTGVHTKQVQQLLVYPNPAHSFMVFELPQNIKNPDSYRGLIITDIYGKLITKINISPQQTQLQWKCENISSGVYFYQTEISGVFYRGKVVIE